MEEEVTDTPTEEEGTEPPAEGDGTETPVEGDGTEPPVADEGTDTPVEGDGTEPPAEDEGTDTPFEGEGTEPPAADEGTDTPVEGDGTEPPAEGDGSDTPAEGEGTVTPENPDENTGTPENPEQGSEGAVVAPEGSVEGSGETTVPAPETPVVTPEVVVPTLLDEVKAAVDELLVTYGLEVGMSEEEIEAVVLDLDWHLDPEADMEALEELAYDLTEEELEELQAYEPLQTWVEFYQVYEEVYSVELMATGTFEPVTGVLVNVTASYRCSESDGAVTVTAKGSGGFLGIGASASSATFTISNSSTATATISFDWTATSVHELKINGAVTGATSGSVNQVLAAGATITITITTEANSTTNKLVMSNFVFTEAAASSAVTFVYDSTLGSVMVDGVAVTDGAVLNIDGTAGAALRATPKSESGATFVGWIDKNNVLVSRDATHQLTPTNDMTVKAVFATTTPCFFGDTTHLFEDLRSAIDFVDTVNNKVVTLANNGTLPAGEYTIPAGVKLLIPFDNANTLYENEPASAGTTACSLYRKLTMADGAKLIINGAMSLSAKSNNSQGNHGSVNGAYSQVEMDSGSSITVNAGGTLYAWGYISGSGTVLAKSGSTVFEFFQVTDWRGGSFMTGSGVIGNANKVFPFLQYYVQNIEVPLTLEAGATEKGYVSIAVSGLDDQNSEIPFIGDDSMFVINSGSVTKDYDEANDRLVLTLNGSISMSSVELSMKVAALFGDITVNSADYVLPINHNLSVTVKSGSTIEITQDIAMLPGSEITIENGATCKVTADKNMFVYDADNWGGYCGSATSVETSGDDLWIAEKF